MFDITTILGVAPGVFGMVAGLGSVLYQRRQTQIMEEGLEKAIEVKITRELDVSEGDPGTQIESKLRAVINRRLSDNRVAMRKEFGPRLDHIEQELQERRINEYSNLLGTLQRLLNDQQDIKDVAAEARGIKSDIVSVQERILAETGRYSVDIANHTHEIETIQQQLDDLRLGVVNPEAARAQIRAIAQQLLQLTSQDSKATDSLRSYVPGQFGLPVQE